MKKVVSLIGNETWIGIGVDVKGSIYEGLLEKNAAEVESGAGQYFTPRPLIDVMTKLIDRRDRCADRRQPSGGAGGVSGRSGRIGRERGVGVGDQGGTEEPNKKESAPIAADVYCDCIAL